MEAVTTILAGIGVGALLFAAGAAVVSVLKFVDRVDEAERSIRQLERARDSAAGSMSEVRRRLRELEQAAE